MANFHAFLCLECHYCIMGGRGEGVFGGVWCWGVGREEMSDEFNFSAYRSSSYSSCYCYLNRTLNPLSFLNVLQDVILKAECEHCNGPGDSLVCFRNSLGMVLQMLQ